MTSYNHTPSDKETPIQANTAQSDSKLIRLIVDLLLIAFIALYVTHCMPAYAKDLNKGSISNVTLFNSAFEMQNLNNEFLDTLGDTKKTLRDGQGDSERHKRDGVATFDDGMMTLDNVTSNGMRNAKSNESNAMSNGMRNQVFAKIGKNQNGTLAIKNNLVNQSISGSGTVNFKNHLTNGDVGGYYKALSKNNSDTPNREPLAFFVPKVYLGSQPIKLLSANHSTHLLQGKTIISIANKLLNLYDGLTLQNTIAIRRICRAVTIVTESKTHHPIINSVVLTQKTIGGLYNA